MDKNEQKEKLEKFIKNFKLDKLGSEETLKEIAAIGDSEQRITKIKKKLKDLSENAGITESTLAKQTSKYKVAFEKGLINIKKENVLNSLAQDIDDKLQEKYGKKDKDEDKDKDKEKTHFPIRFKLRFDGNFVQGLKGKNHMEIVREVRSYILPQLIAQLDADTINKPLKNLIDKQSNIDVNYKNNPNLSLLDLLSETEASHFEKQLDSGKQFATHKKTPISKNENEKSDLDEKEIKIDENDNAEVKKDPENVEEAIDDMTSGSLKPIEKKDVSNLENKDEKGELTPEEMKALEQSALLPPWLRND